VLVLCSLTGSRQQDDSTATETLLLVGQWHRVPPAASTFRHAGALIVRCEGRVRTCQLALTRHEPGWLLLGEGCADDELDALAQAARLAAPGTLLAVLGSDADLVTSERWLRRGCSAFLASASTVDRVLGILRFVRDSDVVVVDKCFQDASYLQQVGPTTDLTRREREVLQWMRVGRHNHEIAEALGVSASTIGFHVRNLLEKLGARNRVEAINRADLLGL